MSGLINYDYVEVAISALNDHFIEPDVISLETVEGHAFSAGFYGYPWEAPAVIKATPVLLKGWNEGWQAALKRDQIVLAAERPGGNPRCNSPMGYL